MTLETWQQDESKAAQLRTLLSDPILVEAFNIAVYSELPKVIPIHQGIDHVTMLALKQSHQAGWHDCIRFLKGTLTKRPEPPKKTLALKSLNPDK